MYWEYLSFSNWRTLSAICSTGKKIDSAGTGALVGHEADASAKRIAEIHGLSLDAHSGKQFTASLGRQYDLILVMERTHLEQIGRIAPEARGKTMLFGHWQDQKKYRILIGKVKKPSPRCMS